MPPGATGKTDKPVFDDGGKLIDPRADSDGDGIADGEEIAGWIVTVDGNGFAVGSVGVDSAGNPVKEALEVREVTSDPRYADTDGDGLNDGEERVIKSDPRRIDTDGDTLSDFEEVRRWATSASSADTDGDARGGDPNNPRPPIFALFDAAELRLMRNPLDPDGPFIAGPGATSPLTNDTDGDGVLDYDEVLAGVRRATVAEVPTVKFAPTPGAELDMYFNVTRSDGTTETTTYGTTTSFEEGGHLSVGTSTRVLAERSDYAAFYIKTKDTFGCCLTYAESETEAGVKIKSETRMEQTVAFSMNTGMYFNSQEAMTEAEAFERTSGVSFSSGTIRVPLDVINTGPLPVRLVDLVVSLVRYDRVTRQVVPVTEIEGQDMSLAPGERRTLELTANDVPIQAMRDLMADPSTLIFEASRFSLLDQYGVDFDFRMSEVLGFSSSITIDFGDRSERFFVASSVEPEGVSVGMALTQLGIDYQAEPFDTDDTGGAEVWDITIEGRGTELHEGPAPDLQELYPYPEGLEPGRRTIKRGWFGAIQTAEDPLAEGPYYANLFDVMVRPGDSVILIYSEDLDRDGVSAFDEARWGSSDLNPHSDSDGMSDYWETRVGWEVETSSRAPYRVFPSPIENDTDGDGLDDDQEAEKGVTDPGTGLDPWLADTDQDGFGDRFEYDDVAYGLDPLQFVNIDDIPRPTVTCEIVMGGRPTGTEPYGYIVRAVGQDPQNDLVEVKVDFGGPVGVYQSAPTGEIVGAQYLDRCFPNPATVTATAKDALGFSATTACVWGEGAPHTEDPCNGVDDDCDGVVDDGCPTIGGTLVFNQVTANLGWVADDDGGNPASLNCAPRLVQGLQVVYDNVVRKLGAYCTTPKLGQPYREDGKLEYIYPVIMEGHDKLFEEHGGDGGNVRHIDCGDLAGGRNQGVMGFY
ncbi:MAG TPA: hypothetical protein PK095_10460, partial [Myxococcota bacterium]|nr:hypothetical protein [Myxococcota bacterium]